MSDPTRLKDMADAPGTSDEVRALLRDASRVPAMTSEDRAAIVAAVSTMGAAGSTGAGSSVAKGSLVTTKTFLAGVASMMVIGAVVGGLSLARPGTQAPVATPTTTPVPPSPSLAASTPVADLPPAVAEGPSPHADDTPAPAASASAPAKSARAGAQVPVSPVVTNTLATPPSPSVAAIPPAAAEEPKSAQPNLETGDTLAKESALIGKARASLESNPREALSLLEDHGRRFPHGELAAERDFLTIKALRRVGRTDDARARARGYAAMYPSSPYVPAVHTLLKELGEP